jgi:dolichol-phosphate mannosyltransferase
MSTYHDQEERISVVSPDDVIFLSSNKSINIKIGSIANVYQFAADIVWEITMITEQSVSPNTQASQRQDASDAKLPVLSIIVPTRNEAGNIDPLLTRLERALKDIPFEVIFVDDSTDNTPEAIRTRGSQCGFDVSVIARPPERRNGLGMAVVEGMKIARADWMVVMDGDLQHPPEVVRQLWDKAKATSADLVVASRLSEGASTAGLSRRRTMLSRTLTLCLQMCFPKNLRNVSDPLTGFFLLRRESFSLEDLHPEGFKILLEIMMRNPQLKVAEVPFEFGKRHSGVSKASPKEMLRLVRQTAKLRMLTMKSLLEFMAVGFTGIFVNSAILFVLSGLMGVNYLIGAIISTQGSTLWNFSWIDRWVFRKRAEGTLNRRQRAVGFFAVNNAMLLLRGPILVLLVAQLGMNYLVANLISLGALMIVRYAISDSLIWGMRRTRKLYYYNIHNIIRIRSEQKLPELGYFKTDAVQENPDFDISIVANPQARRTANSIAYDELLGRVGFSIVIDREETLTKVFASPLVDKSPHVLYTNVVEPLLRWAFVRKGYALMHGACIAVDGEALFITARTDTGKTTTILQLIREHTSKFQFLSDDMTILTKEGKVLNYPKPLTISLHTLKAARCMPDISRYGRAFLRVQSRLHSRGGRLFGMWLTNKNFPGATLNAIVQAIVPPPKFMINQMISKAVISPSAQFSRIAVIERGPEFERSVGEEEALRILMANAEDAYGFPPTLPWLTRCPSGMAWICTRLKKPSSRMRSTISKLFTFVARDTTGISGCRKSSKPPAAPLKRLSLR